MTNDKNYWTKQNQDGTWGVKKEGASKNSRNFNTQNEAWDYAKSQAQKSNGEAFLKNREGKIRERNTYGKDPYPPKG